MSFDVLDRHIEVQRSRFLEASAGTGKTFAIEHLACRLLIEGENPFSIGQILVVTFTRAATRELKQRIRANLEKALNFLTEGGAPFADYLAAIGEASEAKRKEAALRIETALAGYDEAQIFTLHGFCHRILSEFAFEAKIGFALSHPDSGDHRGSLRDLIYDFFRTGIDPFRYSSRQIQSVLSEFDIDELADRLSKWMHKGDRGPDFSEILARFQEALASFEAIEPEKMVEDFERLSSCYKGMQPEMKSQAAMLAESMKTKNGDAEGFDRLLKEKSWFLEKFSEENLKKKFTFPEALHYPGLFPRLCSRLLPLIEEAKNPVAIALRMARDIQDRWDERLEQNQQYTPDDLLIKTEQCLERPSFLKRVREKYRAAIIDEFQDTDPVQWNIFTRLFRAPDYSIPSLYLVGDPKQSIYSFRNADVYVYLRAAEALGEGNRAILDTNFRSEPSLVAALNRLFSASEWLQLPKKGDSLAYAAVKPRPGAADSFLHDQKGAIHFFAVEKSPERERKWPTRSMEQDFFFPFIASEAHRLASVCNIDLQEISVLVKDRFQALDIHVYLKSCGIPSVIAKSRDLTESAAFAGMEQLIEAALNPHDVNKVKIALAGPFIRWNCDRFKTEPLMEAKAAFFHFSKCLREEGFGPFFQAFISSQWDGSSILEKMAGREDLSLYTDVRQVAQLLVEHPVERLLSFMKELKKLDSEEEERIKTAQEGDVCRVQIMTIHASKGLEFDIVFSLGLAGRRQAREEVLKGSGGVVPFDPNQSQCQENAREQEAEKMRQLYVALTRAKKRVYAPLAFNPEQKELKLGEASPIELFGKTLGYSTYGEWKEGLEKFSITVEKLEETSFSSSPADLKKITLIMPEPPSIPGKPEMLLSFTSLSDKIQKEHAPFTMSEGKRDIHALPPGAETGNLLHSVLEMIFIQQIYGVDSIRSLLKEKFDETHLQGWEEIVCGIIDEILHLSIDGFTFTDIAAAKMFQEMEFAFGYGGSILKGFADLVFEYGGKYYIVDWKSNWLGPDDSFYTSENMNQAMEEHDYFLQASIYAAALEKYVKIFDDRPFDEYFGGALYVFLRGRKITRFIPTRDHR